MKNLTGFFLLTFFMFNLFNSVAQVPEGPGVDWRRITWAPHDPQGNDQTQEESGDEWWYAHENSYDASGNIEGYIATGYASWINWDDSEPNGCLDCVADDNNPEHCNFEVDDNIVRYRGCFKQTTAFFDLRGNMVWCKPYNNNTFFEITNTNSNDGYVAVGLTQSTRDLSGNPLYYNPQQN